MYLKMKKKRVGKIKYDKSIYIGIYIIIYILLFTIVEGLRDDLIVLSEFCQSL